jgi:hypothetical protein
MEKEFIPYEQALDLKELGFDEPCFGFYNNAEAIPYIKQDLTDELKLIYTGDFEAPLYQQAFRWFRENYNLLYNINETYEKSSKYIYSIGYGWSDALESYEEAELECLKKLIEIVKQK